MIKALFHMLNCPVMFMNLQNLNISKGRV